MVLDEKLVNVHKTSASFVTTGTPGCLMQLGAGLIRDDSAMRAIHPVDLLDASYAASGGQ